MTENDENDTLHQHLFYTFRFPVSWNRVVGTLKRYAFQQDVSAYADNLIYSVRLRIDAGVRLAKTFS